METTSLLLLTLYNILFTFHCASGVPVMMTFLSSILPGGVLLSASSSSPFSFWGKICNSITKSETDIKGRVEINFTITHQNGYQMGITTRIFQHLTSMLPAFQCYQHFNAAMYLSHIPRKHALKVSDQFRHEPVGADIKSSWTLETSGAGCLKLTSLKF